MFLLSYFSLILFSHFLSLHVSVCFLIFSNFSLFIYFSCLLLRVSAIYFSNFTTLYFFLPFMMLFSSISFAFFVTLLSIIIIIFFFVVCEFFHLGFLCNYPQSPRFMDTILFSQVVRSYEKLLPFISACLKQKSSLLDLVR